MAHRPSARTPGPHPRGDGGAAWRDRRGLRELGSRRTADAVAFVHSPDPTSGSRHADRVRADRLRAADGSAEGHSRPAKSDTRRALGGIPMTYGSEAAALRRCTGTRRDGRPCHAWAMWADERQLCIAHCGRPRRTRAGRGNYWPYQSPPTQRARYKPCRCAAYAWPHRPGGGLCCWPLDPMYRLTRRAGTHSGSRDRDSKEYRLFVRQFRAHQRTGRWPRSALPVPKEIARLVSGEHRSVRRRPTG